MRTSLTTISGRSINQLWLQLLTVSQDWPSGVTRRGAHGMVESPGPVMFELTDPRRRVLSWPGRLNSVPVTAAETLWVLAGRNDIGWLSRYLPRAPQYSDDNLTWRAGYGPRLRRYANNFDQLNCVVNDLISDNDTRRAVMSLHVPQQDGPAVFFSLDYPCNLTLSFMVRNGRLDLTVTARSQDMLFGWFTNFFEFTVLQELVSEMTGIPLGCYYALSNNLHYYPKYAERFSKMRAAAVDYCDLYDFQPPLVPGPRIKSVEELDKLLAAFFDFEHFVRVQERETFHAMWLFADHVLRFGAGCLNDLIWSVLNLTAAQNHIVTETLDRIWDPVMRSATATAVDKELKVNDQRSTRNAGERSRNHEER